VTNAVSRTIAVDPLIDALAARLLLPLVNGGRVVPVRPIGERRAVELADHYVLPGGEIGSELAKARLRAARSLCAIDELADPGPGEWLLAFALNDLLQVTNPSLVGTIGRTRPLALLEMIASVIARAGAPRSVGEALARHATFGRTLELVRFDQHVSWWVGERVFRGAQAPARLLAWERLRRVSKREHRVELAKMPGADAPWAARWLALAARFLAASPLSDLSNAGRLQPAFSWTGASLALLRTPAGFDLALRAVARSDVARNVAAFQQAAKKLPADADDARELVRTFIERAVR
jgi:hypothetical protein